MRSNIKEPFIRFLESINISSILSRFVSCSTEYSDFIAKDSECNLEFSTNQTSYKLVTIPGLVWKDTASGAYLRCVVSANILFSN